MTTPPMRCPCLTASGARCNTHGTHNIRCGDGKLVAYSYSNADGTRSPMALCEEHALWLVELYGKLGYEWSMEPIEGETDE